MINDIFLNEVVYKPLNKAFLAPIASGKLHSVRELINTIKLRNKETAYIVGNSITLNNLTDEQLDKMQRGFVIGFSSFAIYQRLIADLLITEVSEFYDADTGIATLEAIKSRYDNPHRKVLIKDCSFSNINMCGKIVDVINGLESADAYYTEDAFLHGATYELAKDAYERCFKLMKNRYDTPEFIIKKRGSITSALNLLLMADFEDIRFVACELENSNYHYAPDKINNDIHLTENNLKGGLPISECIRAQIDAYNDVYGKDIRLKSYGGKLVKSGIADNFDL